MSKAEALKKKLRKDLRYLIGGVIFFLGTVFMFVPFIPLGYLFLAIGAFLLSPVIPAFRKPVKFTEKKDKSNRIKRAEEKADQYIRKLTGRR